MKVRPRVIKTLMAESMSTSISLEFWHRNLVDIPLFINAFVEKMVGENLPIKMTMTRGYKFFCESYVHDIEVKLAEEEGGITVRAKCFRSMKKNEEPHRLRVVFKRQTEVEVESFLCSCAAGQGLCHHVIGLMYTLAHYQMLGLKSVLPVVSKTSKPQIWHIPSRTEGVSPRPVMDVVVQKTKNPSQQPTQVNQKKKRKLSGVHCTLYKPFEDQLASLNLPSTLSPLFEELNPKPGFLRIWPDEDEDIPLVETRYGLTPRGSVLSYQQQQTRKRSSENQAHPVPNFDFPELGYQPTVLPEKELLHFNSLAVSLDQAREYEEMTRDQSMSRDWHRLRKFRLTASNFKAICSRRRNPETLSTRLLRGKVVQTAAMRYGIQHEDEAANNYSDQFGRAVYSVGFVINPSLPHLGCSPDRRVYDPSEIEPWGLLEIKCSPSDCLSGLNYLKYNGRTGTYSLKKTHACYQIMGCIGLTGSSWEDLFVFCQSEFHSERIYFDPIFFSEMLEKLNHFYFDIHLNTCVT